MPQAQLRIWPAPDSSCETLDESQPKPPQVTVRLGHILPLLADAVESNRTWLRDFNDDEVTITSDLYEVLLAYQFCCRPVAK